MFVLQTCTDVVLYSQNYICFTRSTNVSLSPLFLLMPTYSVWWTWCEISAVCFHNTPNSKNKASSTIGTQLSLVMLCITIPPTPFPRGSKTADAVHTCQREAPLEWLPRRVASNKRGCLSAERVLV